MSEEKKGGLFEKFYAAKQEILDAAKKPGIRRQVKRKLQSCFDDASNKIIEAEGVITKLRQEDNFQKYDVNAILEQRRVIQVAKELQALIKQEFEELFGEPMKVEDED